MAHFYEVYLAGKYSWAPKDTTLNTDILPEGSIRNMEQQFQPMLDAISDNSDVRQKADRLHNMVNAPETKKYIERFHPNELLSKLNVARDPMGNVELSDDWSIPLGDDRLNRVRVGNHIHFQMDFGGETV